MAVTDTLIDIIRDVWDSVNHKLNIAVASLPLPSGGSTSVNQATEIASLASIDGKLANPMPASQSGTWTVQPGNTANTTAWKVDGSAVTQPASLAAIASSTSSLTQVASSASSVTILSSNSSRKMFTLVNDSNQTAYVAFTSSAATSSAYTLKMLAGATYTSDTRIYTGQVNAIWASANGNMVITEFT